MPRPLHAIMIYARDMGRTADFYQRYFGLTSSGEVEGLIELSEGGEWAAVTDALRALSPQYEAEVQEALTFIKPSFNEDMRGGHTNM